MQSDHVVFKLNRFYFWLDFNWLKIYPAGELWCSTLGVIVGPYDDYKFKTLKFLKFSAV